MKDTQEAISRKIVRNSLTNIARALIGFPIGIALTPFLVSQLGIRGYGIWAMASALVSYVGLIDLGMGSSVTKYVAELWARKDTAKINYLLNTALSLYLVLGILMVLLVVSLKDRLITSFFRVDAAFFDEIAFVIIGSLIVFVLNLSFGVFTYLLHGLQRIDLSNIVATSASLLNAVGVVIALLVGLGLRGLVIVSALVTLFSIIASLMLAKREFPNLCINPLLFRRSHVNELLGLGLQLQVVTVATIVFFQLDKLLLGYFVGIEPVAYYEIAVKVVTQLRLIPVTLLGPIMPAASEICALKESARLQALYYRSVKYMTAASFPVFAFVAVFAYPLVRLWLGRNYDQAAFALQFFALANFANLLTTPGAQIIVGIGRPRNVVLSSLLGLSLNILFSVVLIWRYGYTGAVVAASLTLLLSAAYFVFAFHKAERIPFKATMLRGTMFPILVSILGAVAFKLILDLSSGDLLDLVIVGSGFGLVYLLAMLRLPYLDQFDRDQFNWYAQRYRLRLSK